MPTTDEKWGERDIDSCVEFLIFSLVLCNSKYRTQEHIDRVQANGARLFIIYGYRLLARTHDVNSVRVFFPKECTSTGHKKFDTTSVTTCFLALSIKIETNLRNNMHQQRPSSLVPLYVIQNLAYWRML